jgi:hypothetical protein
MRWLPLAVPVVAAVHFAHLLPTTLNFSRFAFGDSGWALTTDALLDAGRAPVADFGYFYGLLTLLIDRAVFAVFGRTPGAVVGLYAACALAVAVGIARVMRAAKLRPPPALYLLACTPIAVMPRGFPSPAHALEAALLANALADHAAGRLGRALALCTVAVFVKPSLGYVYGLILLVRILTGAAPRWRRIVPAAVTGALLTAVLVAVFGWSAVVRTQLPFDAMRAYADAGFGFFTGSGRLFWLPDEPSLGYYRDGVPGIWLASSLVLLASAGWVVRRWREPARGFVLTCAALHLAFVCVLFGNQWSWIYYPYVLFAGAAVGLNVLPRRAGGVLAAGLTVAAVFGQANWLWRWDAEAAGGMWRTFETAGLYATPEEAAAWGEVRQIGRTHRVFVLTRMGCPHLLAPEVDGPRSWCLTRATATPAELAVVRDQIAAAAWVVSPNWHDNDLTGWPELADVLRPFAPARDTPLYRLYRRRLQRVRLIRKLPPPSLRRNIDRCGTCSRPWCRTAPVCWPTSRTCSPPAGSTSTAWRSGRRSTTTCPG